MARQNKRSVKRLSGWKVPWGDATLSALLATQVLITFVAIPLGAVYPSGHMLMDVGHLAFASVCALSLTERWAIRGALLASLLMFAAGPAALDRVGAGLGLGAELSHEMIAAVAFAFNLLVTVLVALRAFGPGHVTAHRVQGAVLVYLNVAALFAIAYGLLEAHAPGSIRLTSGSFITAAPGARTAELSYFSLATITTTGYGDLAPAHQLARSMANMEAVFGQIFPATFVARLVARHLAHGEAKKRDESDAPAQGPRD
jgi:ion channel